MEMECELSFCSYSLRLHTHYNDGGRRTLTSGIQTVNTCGQDESGSGGNHSTGLQKVGRWWVRTETLPEVNGRDRATAAPMVSHCNNSHNNCPVSAEIHSLVMQSWQQFEIESPTRHPDDTGIYFSNSWPAYWLNTLHSRSCDIRTKISAADGFPGSFAQSLLLY